MFLLVCPICVFIFVWHFWCRLLVFFVFASIFCFLEHRDLCFDVGALLEWLAHHSCMCPSHSKARAKIWRAPFVHGYRTAWCRSKPHRFHEACRKPTERSSFCLSNMEVQKLSFLKIRQIDGARWPAASPNMSSQKIVFSIHFRLQIKFHQNYVN